MKAMKLCLGAFMALFLTFGLASCGDDDDDTTPRSGKGSVTAEVMISSSLLDYFDGQLTFAVGDKTQTATLKKSAGTKERLTTNYALYRFKVVMSDVALSSNATNVSATLTYKRNSTAGPTDIFDFLDAAAIKFSATNAGCKSTTDQVTLSAPSGNAAESFETVYVPEITTRSYTQSASFIYSASENFTATFDDFISSAERMAEILERDAADRDMEL